VRHGHRRGALFRKAPHQALRVPGHCDYGFFYRVMGQRTPATPFL